MQTTIIVKIVFVLLVVLCPVVIRASAPEIVVTKSLSAYEGKSYLFTVEVVLLPGFEVSGALHGDFFVAYERLVNQPASVDKNFVRSEIVLIKGVVNENQLSTLTSDKKRTTYNYSDGLGRFLQEVSLEESSTKADVVRFAAYDDFGREPINYLPVTVKNNVGSFTDKILQKQTAYYHPMAATRPPSVAGDNEPYGISIFDNSPLNAVVRKYGPGEDWHSGKADKFQRMTPKVNISNEVRLWTYNEYNLPQSSSFYAPNALTVNEVVDEENYVRRTYSNFKQQVILERKGDGTIWLDTYHVYDQAGNLSFVFPPEATNRIFQSSSEYHGKTAAQQQTFIDTWAYQYKYDNYGRLTDKRIPGAGWIYMLYDRWDRLVLLQDANQRLSNQWTFTKYDVHNRVIMTGITTGTRSAMQSGLNAATVRFESPTTNSVGYSNGTFPSHSESDLLSINYFDSYSFLTNSGWDSEGLSYAFVAEPGFDQTSFNSLKGYSTGSKIRLLGTSKWLNSVIYYNSQYQVIQTISENHLGGTDRTSKLVDFDGAERLAKQTHSSPAGSLTVAEEYNYDHARRLLKIGYQINNEPKIILTSNTYNELGQFIEKNLHSIDGGSSFLQSVDMRYNIRGWITSINNSQLSNDGVKNNDAGDLFGMQILYNEPPLSIADGNNGTFTTRKLYDGNVSAIRWMTDNRSGVTPKENIYGFAYDSWKRFKNSYYATNNAGQWNASPGYFNETINRFDANGNIGGEAGGTNAPALSRTGLLSGTKVTFDNLTYRYVGNQLKNVTDNSNTVFGFSDKPGVPLSSDEFLYDANGNLKEDMNRSISRIIYNHINLPTMIEMTRQDGKIDKIEYSYDASGTKLSRIVKLNNVKVWQTDFVNGIQIDNGKISFVATPEGRAVFNGANFEYEYFYKDHQDNVRLVYGALKETSRYKATMEPELASTEEDSATGFGNIALRRTTSSNATFNFTAPSDKTPSPGYSAICNAFENRTIGPAKSLRVMQGDVVYMETFAKYTTALPSGHQTIASAAVGIALNAALKFTSTSEPKIYSGINASAGGASAGVPGGALTPKAYLAFLFFDDNYNFQRSGAIGISINALNSFEKLSRSFTADKSGYLYVYVASESNVSAAKVYFDDTYVIHQKNNVMLQVTQSSDYYPFGLAFNEYQADRLKVTGTSPETIYGPTLRNRYRFQGQEQQSDLGLGWYAYKYRMHDPTTGRFSSVDPIAEDYKYNSPYAFSENRLIDGVELEGKEFTKSLFEIAKYVSPIAFNVDVEFGSHKTGIGYEVSWGVPKMLPFSYRKSAGTTFYSYDLIQKKSMTEHRSGIETSYFGIVSTQSIKYSSGETSQTIGMVTLGNPLLNIQYSNDWFSDNNKRILDPFNFHPRNIGDGGDRYRTAALKLNVGMFNAGFNLATGDPGFEIKRPMMSDGGYQYYAADPQRGINPDKFRFGTSYIGFGGWQLGVNNEFFRHQIQNVWTHDPRGYPRFSVLPSNDELYLQYSTGAYPW
jgi:RHS repeat-associated protein